MENELTKKDSEITKIREAQEQEFLRRHEADRRRDETLVELESYTLEKLRLESQLKSLQSDLDNQKSDYSKQLKYSQDLIQSLKQERQKYTQEILLKGDVIVGGQEDVEQLELYVSDARRQQEICELYLEEIRIERDGLKQEVEGYKGPSGVVSGLRKELEGKERELGELRRECGEWRRLEGATGPGAGSRPPESSGGRYSTQFVL